MHRGAPGLCHPKDYEAALPTAPFPSFPFFRTELAHEAFGEFLRKERGGSHPRRSCPGNRGRPALLR